MSTLEKAEFAKLDSGGLEKWFKWQQLIFEKRKLASGTVEDPRMTYDLVAKFSAGFSGQAAMSNTDCIRLVLKDPQITTKARNLEEFPSDWKPDISDLMWMDNGRKNYDGKPFLVFANDDQPKPFFQKVMGLKPDFEPDDTNILSFGSNPKNLTREENEKFGFPKIFDLATKLGYTYVDSDRLPRLAASYKLPGVTFALNAFWNLYYQKAMEKAETMVFLMSSGWINSKNCWEELEWAAEKRPKFNFTYKNIFIFTKKEHFEKIEAKNIIEIQPPGDPKTYKYNWKDLKSKVGFPKSDIPICLSEDSTNFDEVPDIVKNYVRPTEWYEYEP